MRPLSKEAQFSDGRIPEVNPTYSVICDDPRYRAILGDVPVADGSALLREWDRAGFRRLSIDVARAFGAAVVALKDPADAEDLIREHG
jgi:hypothetical protein